MSEERKLFVGRKVPEEIKALTKLKVSNIKKETLHIIVSSVLDSILEKICTLSQIQQAAQNDLNKDDFLTLVSGLHKLLFLILKSNLNSKEILEEDLKELKLDPILITIIVEIVFNSRKELLAQASHLGPEPNSLKSFDWRVDVGISNSALCKELQAVVTMKMLTTDGKTNIFEVPQKMFHELRFNVAMVLKEMELLENSRYLSIADSN